MSLPRWLRHQMAKFLSTRADEVGGMLFDYANGKFELLQTCNDVESAEKMLDVIGNMFDRAEDEIYIAVIKCVGEGNGYFVVHDSNGDCWERSFWRGIYEPQEAYIDMCLYCRKIATKMGYRRPE